MSMLTELSVAPCIPWSSAAATDLGDDTARRRCSFDPSADGPAVHVFAQYYFALGDTGLFATVRHEAGAQTYSGWELQRRGVCADPRATRCGGRVRASAMPTRFDTTFVHANLRGRLQRHPASAEKLLA